MNKLNLIENFIEYCDAIITAKKSYIVCVAFQGDWMRGGDISKILKILHMFNFETRMSKKSLSLAGVFYREQSFISMNSTSDSKVEITLEGRRIKIYANSHIPCRSIESDGGIYVDEAKVAYAIRGINFAIIDPMDGFLKDSVVFDIVDDKEKIARPFRKAELLRNRLMELRNGFGYSLAQFLYDIGVDSINVYAEQGFEDLVKEVLLPFEIYPKISILKMCSSVEYKLTYHYDGFLPKLNFHEYKENCFSNGAPVLIATSFCNSFVKMNLKKYKVFEIEDIIAKAFSYISREEVIMRLIAENPGVRAVSYSKPKKETCYPSPAHNQMITDNYSTDRIFTYLCNNISDLRKISKPMYDAGYSKEEWAELMCKPIPIQYTDQDGFIHFEDTFGSGFGGVNIYSGHRKTAFVPQQYKNTIYIFGDCNTFGIFNKDEDTYCSKLQELLNEAGYNYRVENYGWFLFNYGIKIASIVSQIKPINGDIIIFEQNRNSGVFEFPHLPLKNEKIPVIEGDEYFYDKAHYTPRMHEWLARKFFDFLVENDFFEHFPKKVEYKTTNYPLAGLLKINTLNDYIMGIDRFKTKMGEFRVPIGAIVMNCNPFTNGHRYLIEIASRRVEYLYVFVVEEDRSYFSFEDRYHMVLEGISDLKNVRVLPSGQYMISSRTFVDYFNKTEIQDKRIDPSMDVEIFGKHIAPYFGINIRFAGEEPNDKITKQYNETMKFILPKYGITFCEIKRKKYDSNVISASIVRKMIKDMEWDRIRKIVPDSTYNYLTNNKKKILHDNLEWNQA